MDSTQFMDYVEQQLLARIEQKKLPHLYRELKRGGDELWPSISVWHKRELSEGCLVYRFTKSVQIRSVSIWAGSAWEFSWGVERLAPVSVEPNSPEEMEKLEVGQLSSPEGYLRVMTRKGRGFPDYTAITDFNTIGTITTPQFYNEIIIPPISEGDNIEAAVTKILDDCVYNLEKTPDLAKYF